jgi:hypothetical protein
MTSLLCSSGGDGVGVFLGVLVVTIVVVAAIAISSSQSDRLRKALRAVAERVNGRVVEGGWVGEPSLVFSLAGMPAKLEFFDGSKHSSPFSRVVVHLGGRAPGTLHILPEGFAQSFLKLFGAQDISVGDAVFDLAYVIKASPESLVPQIFSPERRERVMASVRRLASFTHPTIDLDRNQLMVQTREVLRTAEGHLRLISTAEDFLKYLFPVAPEAVAGIQWGEVRVESGGECPVCGTAMSDRLVRCEVCQTPHHSECWTYMGRCSTYGCRGKRSVA